MFHNRKAAVFTSLLSLAALLSLLAQFFAFRPIQDDYFILGALSQQNVVSIISSVWNLQGGNILPYAINALLLDLSENSLAFFASKIFILATTSLMFLVALSFIRWFGIQNRYAIVAYTSISLLAFEGIFTPSQIAAYSWHQTSITHLWPIALTVISWEFAGSRRSTGILLVVCGLVVGNTNSAEALWAIIATFLYIKTFLQGNEFSTRIARINLRFFFFSCILGFIFIISAPGFWNRANNSVGMPQNAADFGFRLGKSASAFGFDLLTHPFLWIAFLIGLSCKSKIDLNSKFGIREIRKFLIRISFLLYFLLVLGTTLGYPAWHQSLGLYVVMLPSMFIVGCTLELKFPKYIFGSRKLLFYILLVFCLSLSIRSSWLVLDRAHQWDSAYQSNVCSIYSGDTSVLKGAEIVYPIFNKGIEDISSWPWMKQSYVLWITNQNSNIYNRCIG